MSEAHFYYTLIPFAPMDATSAYETHLDLADIINDKIEKEGGEYVGVSTIWTSEKPPRPLNFIVFKNKR